MLGNFTLLDVLLATLAFWVVGAIWYGMLFNKVWQRETGIADAPAGRRIALVMGLTLAFEMLVVVFLAHMVAFSAPSNRVVMMMASGFAVGIMIPAIGINYLHQRRSLALFLVDAGHFLFGMLAVGGALIALR